MVKLKMMKLWNPSPIQAVPLSPRADYATKTALWRTHFFVSKHQNPINSLDQVIIWTLWKLPKTFLTSLMSISVSQNHGIPAEWSVVWRPHRFLSEFMDTQTIAKSIKLSPNQDWSPDTWQAGRRNTCLCRIWQVRKCDFIYLVPSPIQAASITDQQRAIFFKSENFRQKYFHKIIWTKLKHLKRLLTLLMSILVCQTYDFVAVQIYHL